MSIILTANLAPGGNFPIVTTEVISGGYQTVADIAARDAITTVGVDSAVALDGFRREGMLVYVQSTGDTYKLVSPLTNANWVLQTSGGGIPVPTPAIQDLYVSGLNGSDLNDGSTPLLAVATLARAWALIPDTLAAPLVVHLGAAGAPGTPYTWAPMPTPAQLTPNARIWLYGDGAGQAGEDGFEVVAGSPTAAIAGTGATQITTAAIVANAYQGFTLEVVDGPAAGYRRTIFSNSTSSIVPCRRFENDDGTASITPLAGNTIRILRPTVIFSGYDTAGNTDGIPGLFSGIGNGDGGAPLLLVNLAFDSVSNQAEINRCTIFGAGIEFRGTVAPIFTNCNGSFGNWDNLFNTVAVQATLPQDTNLSLAKTNWATDIGLGLAPSFLATWRGWGVSQPDVIAVTAATTGLRFLSCQMSMFATVGDLHASSSTLTLGGRFYGDVTFERGFLLLIARANVVSDSAIFARKIYTELATVLTDTNAGTFTYSYTGTVEAQWVSVSCDVRLGSAGAFSSATAAFLRMSGGGTFSIESQWDFNYSLDKTSDIGLIHVEAGTFTQDALFTSTNAITGAVRQAPTFLVETAGTVAVSAGFVTNINGDAAATLGSDGILVQNGGKFIQTAAIVLDPCELIVDGGSFLMAADLTLSPANTQEAITLQNRASFVQTLGILTVTGGTIGTGIEVSGSEWLSTGGSLSVSGRAPLRITEGSQVVATAGVGAWTLSSTISANAIASTDSEFISNNSSLTLTSLASSTPAISATRSSIKLSPTTLTFTLGGITLNDASNMSVGVDAVITGSLTMTLGSLLLTTDVFSTTLATSITDSTCHHLGATTYNSASTCLTSRSELTFAGTSNIRSTNLNNSTVRFNSTATFPTTMNTGGSNLSFQGGPIITGSSTLTNTFLLTRSGTMTVGGTFTLNKSNIRTSSFTGAAVTLIKSIFIGESTFTATGVITISQNSSLVATGGATFAAVVLTDSSEMVTATAGITTLSITDSRITTLSNTFCTGGITMARSVASFRGRTTCTALLVDDNSQLMTLDFNVTTATIRGMSSWWAETGGAANVIGGLVLDNAGSAIFFQAVPIIGVLTVASNSVLTTIGVFSATGSTTILDSECVHVGATTYNSASLANITRGRISAGSTFSLGTGVATLTQSELVLADVTTANGALVIDNSTLNCTATFNALSTVDGENSSWEIDNGNLAVTGAFTLTRCDVNVMGTFSALSASLTDSDMSVSSTFGTTNATTLLRASKLVVSGALTAGSTLDVTQSELVLQAVSSCTGALTFTNSRLVCSNTFNALSTATGVNSTLDMTVGNLAVTSDFVVTSCDLNLAGNFNANSATLTSSGMRVAGTYTCSFDTILQLASTLAVTGAVNITDDFSITQSSVFFEGVAIITDAFTIQNATLNTSANFTIGGATIGENSTIDIDGGNLATPTTFTVARCVINVGGDFSSSFVTLTDTDMSVVGTYTDLNNTVVQRNSNLVVTGILNAVAFDVTRSSIVLNGLATCTGAVDVTNSRINCSGNFSTTATLNGENSTWDTDGANLSSGGSCTWLRCDVNVNGTFTANVVTLTDSDMSVSSTYLDNGDTLLTRASKLVVTGSMTSDNLSLEESSDLLVENTLTAISLTADESAAQTNIANISGATVLTSSRVVSNGAFTTDDLTLTNSDMHALSTLLDNGFTALNRTSKLVVVSTMTADNVSVTEDSELFLEDTLTTAALTVTDSKARTNIANLSGNAVFTASKVVCAGRLDCNRLTLNDSNLDSRDFDIEETTLVLAGSLWVARGTVASTINASAFSIGLKVDNSHVDFSQQTGMITVRANNTPTNAAIDVEGAATFIWDNLSVQVVSPSSYYGLTNNGGSVVCYGACTNINGDTGSGGDDFQDQSGSFANTLLIAARTFFQGQHAGGVYDITAVPTGTTSYQTI